MGKLVVFLLVLFAAAGMFSTLEAKPQGSGYGGMGQQQSTTVTRMTQNGMNGQRVTQTRTDTVSNPGMGYGMGGQRVTQTRTDTVSNPGMGYGMGNGMGGMGYGNGMNYGRKK